VGSTLLGAVVEDLDLGARAARKLKESGKEQGGGREREVAPEGPCKLGARLAQSSLCTRQVYSPTTTVPVARLANKPAAARAPDPVSCDPENPGRDAEAVGTYDDLLQEAAQQRGVLFFRLNFGNDALMRALRDELQRRGVRIGDDARVGEAGFSELLMCLVDGTLDARTRHDCSWALWRDFSRAGLYERDHVVLISEWDTAFGRNLPRELERVMSAGTGDCASRERIHRFSYLRGLDGSLPGERQRKKPLGDDKGTEPREKRQVDGERWEAAVGDDQFDYLQRLAGQIGDLNRELWRKNEERIAAIGVLGSDYYDKLLILRALRDRFSDTLFFTIDLDARYLDPDYERWTRNLIVGSTFGLALRADLQCGVPRFRDSFQTGRYLATLLAVGGGSQVPVPVASQCDDSETLRPLVFEIGRRHAVRLRTDDLLRWSSDDRICVQAFPRCRPPLGDSDSSVGPGSLHASPPLPHSGKALMVALLVGIGFVGLFGYLLFPSFRKNFSTVRGVAGICVGVLSLVGTLYWLVLLPFASQRLEPFAWSEGVSVWPTLFIRVLTGIAIVGAIVYASRKIKASERKIESLLPELAPTGKRVRGEHGRALGALPKCWIRMRRRLRRVVDRARSGKKRKKQDQSILEAYEAYLESAGWWCRSLRALAAVFVFWFFSFVLISVFGAEIQPVRGLASAWTDRATELVVGGLLYLFLLFLVLDAARLNVELMRAIRRRCHCTFDLSTDKPWKSLRAIVVLTTPMHSLLTVPFIALFLLLLGRLTLFDNWHFPIAYKGLVAIALTLLLLVAATIRRQAEKVRSSLLEQIETFESGHRTASLKKRVMAKEPGAAESLQETLAKDLRERISTLNEGAFQSWHHQPVVQNLLWLFASLSVLGLDRFFH
jgi:hypothetical protein